MKQYNLSTFISDHDLNNSLLIGYYGGGNFGDELLLYAFCDLLKSAGNNNVDYYYTNRRTHSLMNHAYVYQPLFSKKELLIGLLFKRNIIIGGGGHWGMDASNSTLLLSVILFIARYVLRKKVYLLGVGFYSSTNDLGRFSARVAAKASNIIIARDKETYDNFSEYCAETYLDKDAVFYLNTTKLKSYSNDLGVQIDLNKHYIVLAIRRFNEGKNDSYSTALKSLVTSHPSVNFLLCMFETEEMYPEGKEFLQNLNALSKSSQIIKHDFAPIDFIKFMSKFRKNIYIVAPQYHVQLTAHLMNVAYLPFHYDNKVSELSLFLGVDSVDIADVTDKIIIDGFKGQLKNVNKK